MGCKGGGDRRRQTDTATPSVSLEFGTVGEISEFQPGNYGDRRYIRWVFRMVSALGWRLTEFE